MVACCDGSASRLPIVSRDSARKRLIGPECVLTSAPQPRLGPMQCLLPTPECGRLSGVLSSLPVAVMCEANEPPQHPPDVTCTPLCDRYMLLCCRPDGAAEACGGRGWSTGTTGGRTARRFEGGSATSRYHASMNQPLDCRLRAGAARRGAYRPKMRAYRETKTNSRTMTI